MAESIAITVFGDDLFRRRIQTMRYRARDMSPVLDVIADDWADVIDEQFETEGKRSGHPWQQLKPSTISRRGSNHPILIDDGDMFAATGRDNIHVSDDGITLVFDGPEGQIAEAHQYGFHNALTGTDVPARPLFKLTPEDTRRYRDKITDYLVHGRL